MEAQDASRSAGVAATENNSSNDETIPGEQDSFDTAELGESLSAIDRQYAVQTEIPRRIHIMGVGSIGKLIAHAIRGIANPPPVTLMLYKRSSFNAWEKSKQEITINDDGTEIRRGGYDAELMPLVKTQHGVQMEAGKSDLYDYGDSVRPHEAARAFAEQRQPQAQGSQREVRSRQAMEAGMTSYVPDDGSEEPIHNLIVTLKGPNTLSALRKIQYRLLPSSTICFLQNGMGVIDELNTELFPDPTTRPNYMQGIITHGVNVPPAKAAQDPFYAVHAGHGTIALGLLRRTPLHKPTPSEAIRASAQDKHDLQSELWAPSSRYLLRTLTRTPVLAAVGFAPTELLQQQLEKLAVNSVLNPLTVLLDSRNGGILYNFAMTRTMRLMLAETSLVIRSLPELANIPNIATRFSAQRLETLVVSVANTTKDNVSSMLADVRAGRQTEVEYINGYIVKRGEEMGIKCVVNYSIMQLVLGKGNLVQHEVREGVRIEGSNSGEH